MPEIKVNNQLTEYGQEQIIKLYKSRKTYKEIGEMLKISSRSAWETVKKYKDSHRQEVNKTLQNLPAIVPDPQNTGLLQEEERTKEEEDNNNIYNIYNNKYNNINNIDNNIYTPYNNQDIDIDNNTDINNININTDNTYSTREIITTNNLISSIDKTIPKLLKALNNKELIAEAKIPELSGAINTLHKVKSDLKSSTNRDNNKGSNNILINIFGSLDNARKLLQDIRDSRK